MGPVDALKIALARETESINLYNQFYLQFPELKELLLFLVNEEEKHKQLIEKKITEVTT